MAEVLNITVDMSRFDAAFKRYLEVTHRSFSDAANKKAFYIARKAVWKTEKADAAGIKSSLGGWVRVQKTAKKSGRIYFRRTLQLAPGRDTTAPLAALIIQSRRAKKGEKGLYGGDPEMSVSIRSLLAARKRSISYIRSGWVRAVRDLAPFAGATPQTDGAEEIGRPKGHAEPARNIDGSVYIAKIFNEAWAKHDKTGAFERVGRAGLQMAVDDEVADTERQIAKEMQPAADEFNRS